MENKYQVKRTITITVIDYIVAKDESEVAAKLDNGPSLAGEISSMGIAALHRNVSYTNPDDSITMVDSNVLGK